MDQSMPPGAPAEQHHHHQHHHQHQLGMTAASREFEAAAVAAAAAAAYEPTVQDARALLASYQPDPTAMGPPLSPTYGDEYHQVASMAFMPTSSQTNYHHHAGLAMHAPMMPFETSAAAAAGALPWTMDDFQDVHREMMALGAAHGLPNTAFGPGPLPDGSPTDTYLEVRSLTSASSDNGWGLVDYPGLETYRDDQQQQAQVRAHQAPTGAVCNPSETLHIRSNSDSSYSDISGYGLLSLESFDEIGPPLASPTSDGQPEVVRVPSQQSHHSQHSQQQQQQLPAPIPASSDPEPSTWSAQLPMTATTTATTTTTTAAANISPAATVVHPVPIPAGPSPVVNNNNNNNNNNGSSTSSSPSLGSPSTRRPGRKSPTTKASKPTIRRASPPTAKKETEKRVGRRRGPLLPEARKQANEIRKLRACLRCKFLKKVCDKGEPCAGCQPSHHRLWQVPCTRIDIKDVAYFMKDWKADFERHVRLEFSIGNIRGFAPAERTLYVTHGYGYYLAIPAREVFVRDAECFTLDWVESIHETPLEFAVSTAPLSAGANGISLDLLSEYLDRHIDGGFDLWVDDHFEGTPFLTEILKTVYRYYQREPLPVLRQALKLVLAYNLTLHLTLVKSQSEDDKLPGEITDETSKFLGQTLAPVMINFEIKCAMAKMWRALQKDVLDELSSLYSSVYSGEKLKNWPTIFMLVVLLLAVWEEMQFDCHYRVPVGSSRTITSRRLIDFIP